MNKVPMIQKEPISKKHPWEVSSKIKLFNVQSNTLARNALWKSQEFTLDGEEDFVMQQPTAHCLTDDFLYLGLNTGEITKIHLAKPKDKTTISRINLSKEQQVWNKFGSRENFEQRRKSLEYASDVYTTNPEIFEEQNNLFEQGIEPWYRVISLSSIAEGKRKISSLIQRQDGTVIDASVYGVFDTSNNILLSENCSIFVGEVDGEVVHIPLYESFNSLLEKPDGRRVPGWGSLTSTLENTIVSENLMRADVSGPSGLGELCINNGIAYLRGGNGYEYIEITDLSNNQKRRVHVGDSRYFVKHGRQVYDVRHNKSIFAIFPSTASYKEDPIFESELPFTVYSTGKDLLVAYQKEGLTVVESLQNNTTSEIEGNWSFMRR